MKDSVVIPELPGVDAQDAPPWSLGDIVISMPSAEELRASSLVWLDRVGPTLIDQWPADVLALSMPTKFVRFPRGMIDDVFEPHQRGAGVPVSVAELAAELDTAMGWERQFVRLNSRSPKDAPWPFEVPATLSGKEAMVIMACSERILDDLCFFEHIPEQPAYVCLRRWDPRIRSWGEYRCFVKDGELIAVSHYDYHHRINVPADGGKAIRELIGRWFIKTLKPRLHLQTVVFDVFLGDDGPLLIELNPYGLSDPCWLGNYRSVERFSGYVAFRKRGGRVDDGASRSATKADSGTTPEIPSKVTPT